MTRRTRKSGGATLSGGDSGLCLVLGVRLENQLAHTVVRGGVGDRTQQRKTAALAIDGILSRGERNVSTVPGTALPDAETDQLQSIEGTIGEWSSASASLPGGLFVSFDVILTTTVGSSPGGRCRVHVGACTQTTCRHAAPDAVVGTT